MISVALCCLLTSGAVLQQVSPPLQLVRAQGLWVGKYEVTQSQYLSFVKDSGYDGSEHPSSKASEPFLNDWKNGLPPGGKEKYPVCNLNWHHAQAFCVWLAQKSDRPVRLLTDAEWTLVASRKEGRVYPWGDQFDIKRCNTGTPDDGYSEAAPVGSFPLGATPEGVHEMAGNIWEWSADGHLRGGPWCMGPDTVLCAKIAREDQDRCDDKFGFRVCVAD